MAAVQAVRTELEAALPELPAGAPEALRAWKPAWLAEIERNLAEPFQGDGSGALPPGSLAGLLRQSGLFVQLRATLLVDPAAMERVGGLPLPSLSVQGQTLGQALATLVHTLHLRVVLEDGVVWLRE